MRLPYGEGSGTTHTNLAYSGLFYPMTSATGLSGETEWTIGEPTYKTLSQPQFQALEDGDFAWQNPNDNSLSAVYTSVDGVSANAGSLF
jgi:hypothetical protein